MRRLHVGSRTLFVMDSVSYITELHRGAVLVTGSHGGLSSGRYALEHPPALVIFNDAGVGKDEAGVAALAQLHAAGIAAAAVHANSARIGDGEDTWSHGVLSRLNALAIDLGLREGESLQVGLKRWLEP